MSTRNNLLFTAQNSLCVMIIILFMITGTLGCRQQGSQNLEQDERMEQEKERQVADGLHLRAVELYGQGKYQEALPLAQQALDIKRRVLGEDDQSTADTLENVAKLYELTGDFPNALPLYKRSLEVHRKVDRQSTATSLNNLGGLYRSMGQYDEAEPLLKEAVEIHQILGEGSLGAAGSFHNLAQLYYSKGDYLKAEPLFQEALKIYKKRLGEEHPDYATSLNNVAGFYRSMGDYATAESYYKEAFAIRKKVLGEDDRSTADILANLAPLYELMGDYANAESLYKQTVNTARKLLGETHPNTVASLNTLAGLYQLIGDYVKAELLFKRSLEITTTALGEGHLSTSAGLNRLAYLYKLTGDRASAERLQLQVTDLYKKALDEGQSDYAVSYATSLNNLAGLYRSYGEFSKAEPMYKQAFEIRRKELGKEHWSTTAIVSNLALVNELMGDNAKAEPLYKQALETHKTTVGDDHYFTAVSLNNLAGLYTRMGKFADAESLQKEAFGIHNELLGKEHPDTVASGFNLASIYHAMGDYAKAESLLDESVGILERHLIATYAIPSGQQQKLEVINLLRENFEAWMSVSPHADIEPSRMSSGLLTMKRTAYTSETRARRTEQNDEVAELVKSLQTLSRKYATVAYHVPLTAEQSGSGKKRITELIEQLKKTEIELSSKSKQFQRQLEAEHMTGDEFQKVLPKSAALVDFFSYARFTPAKDAEKEKPKRERHLLAMVIRHDQPIARVELGPLAPIAAAINVWREHLAKSDSTEKSGQQLRGLLWQPLEPLLADIKTVLISPDDVTAQIPFAALPGSKPGSYLLEERAIAVVPIPQLLQLIADIDPSLDTQPSLMLVGGVDYSGPTGESESRAASHIAAGRQTSDELLQFSELSDSSSEIASVREIFEKHFPKGLVHQQQKSDATESAFNREASKHRWLHLATHGYFAPSQVSSALAPPDEKRQTASLFGRRSVSGIQPGLLTGIVLAGANTELNPNKDDGILTALEVEALDLGHVELVMFSNCETGLGQVAGGEGLLPLQRAFQIAGAKTFVASLWNVPHEANMRLMQRFYDNLLDKNMSKVEALREAQLWLMKNPDKSQGLDQLPPKFWGAFVLSGDWR